jgi:UDP-GlcNAc:undecaprenyl-phosphate GlcNAc-1-phosphate transferase
VPRTGGIAVLCGIVGGTLLLARLSGPLGVPFGREVVALLIGGGLVHVLGLLDDLCDLPAKIKLTAQACIVGIVVSQGLLLERLVFPGGWALELGALAFPVSCFFLLGFINAINLMDGLDGLASGICAIAALTLALAGVLGGNLVLTALSLIVLGAIMGFLPFNFLRGKTFLGDAGSMLLGYLLGAVAIVGSRFSGTSIAVFAVLASAAVPIFDTATTILRRSRDGRALFRADSMHIHHRLIRFGMSPARSVMTILATSAFIGGQGLVFLVGGARPVLAITTLAGLLVVLGIRNQLIVNREDTDAGFREILFYLLGAQGARDPRWDGDLAIVDVLAMAGGNGGNGGNGNGNGNGKKTPAEVGTADVGTADAEAADVDAAADGERIRA